jgi:hypothetical protein
MRQLQVEFTVSRVSGTAWSAYSTAHPSTVHAVHSTAQHIHDIAAGKSQRVRESESQKVRGYCVLLPAPVTVTMRERCVRVCNHACHMVQLLVLCKTAPACHEAATGYSPPPPTHQTCASFIPRHHPPNHVEQLCVTHAWLIMLCCWVHATTPQPFACMPPPRTPIHPPPRPVWCSRLSCTRMHLHVVLGATGCTALHANPSSARHPFPNSYGAALYSADACSYMPCNWVHPTLESMSPCALLPAIPSAYGAAACAAHACPCMPCWALLCTPHYPPTHQPHASLHAPATCSLAHECSCLSCMRMSLHAVLGATGYPQHPPTHETHASFASCCPQPSAIGAAAACPAHTCPYMLCWALLGTLNYPPTPPLQSMPPFALLLPGPQRIWWGCPAHACAGTLC